MLIGKSYCTFKDFAGLGDEFVSCQRVEKFLLFDELKKRIVLPFHLKYSRAAHENQVGIRLLQMHAQVSGKCPFKELH
jgi:hypothetical protein